MARQEGPAASKVYVVMMAYWQAQYSTPEVLSSRPLTLLNMGVDGTHQNGDGGLRGAETPVNAKLSMTTAMTSRHLQTRIPLRLCGGDRIAEMRRRGIFLEDGAEDFRLLDIDPLFLGSRGGRDSWPRHDGISPGATASFRRSEHGVAHWS